MKPTVYALLVGWADDSKPWQPLCDCAEMHEGLGDLRSALDCYGLAIERLEARRSLLSRDDLKTALASDKGSRYLYFLAARAALPPGTALLEYFFLGEDLLAWAIAGGRPTQTLHAATDARALTRLIYEFHGACERKAPVDALAEKLAGTLLQPFAETIRASERLIIVPYDAAHILPFHALPYFATHGILSAEAPLNSSIALADGGELTVYELMGLQLRADLVVLSAYNTARGETTGGDDVLGLTRDLLAAGARAAVVSLWKVNDVSTSLFMGHFYRRLRGGDEPATALQSAQNYLRSLSSDLLDRELGGLNAALKDAGFDRDVETSESEPPPEGYGHPYFWSPFILVG